MSVSAIQRQPLGAPPSADPELDGLRSRPSRIHTVLLATDLKPTSDPATEQAIDLAATVGARLLVVNVIDTVAVRDRREAHARFGGTVTRVDQERTANEGPLLSIVDTARRRGVDATYLLWTGKPGQGIVAAAEAEGADLIVVGTRGLDRAGRFLLGSVSDYVINNSSCPVLVARVPAA